MTDLDDLIERVEKASGPDRVLEIDIYCAFHHGLTTREYLELNEAGTPDIPSYLSSLDAAMSLVPEGWNGRLGWCAGAGYAELIHFAAGEANGETIAAATLPLAVVVAALRARKDT